MLDIEIQGFGHHTVKVKKRIDECMYAVGLKDEAMTTKHYSDTGSCDGKCTPRPYLRIFSSEIKHIPIVLKGFQDHGIHEEVEVISDKVMFFKKEEIASGAWKKKFEEKTGIVVK